MRTFAANTGFLFKDLPFLDRFQAAKDAGFHALEFHDEAQLEHLGELKAALSEVGMPVLGLNVRMGETAGCASFPDRIAEAESDIDAACETAKRIGARAVHVLAGKGDGADRATFIKNIRYALKQTNKTILIEPISGKAISGYHLQTIDDALSIVEAVGHRRLKIMFDSFHVNHEEGEAGVLSAFERAAPHIGHVQIASFPARTEPNSLSSLLTGLEQLGYGGSYGAEYRPESGSFSWMKTLGATTPGISEPEDLDD